MGCSVCSRIQHKHRAGVWQGQGGGEDSKAQHNLSTAETDRQAGTQKKEEDWGGGGVEELRKWARVRDGVPAGCNGGLKRGGEET